MTARAASETFRALATSSRRELERVFLRGESPSIASIVGHEYRGYNTAWATSALGIRKSSRPSSRTAAVTRSAATPLSGRMDSRANGSRSRTTPARGASRSSASRRSRRNRATTPISMPCCSTTGGVGTSRRRPSAPRIHRAHRARLGRPAAREGVPRAWPRADAARENALRRGRSRREVSTLPSAEGHPAGRTTAVQGGLVERVLFVLVDVVLRDNGSRHDHQASSACALSRRSPDARRLAGAARPSADGHWR